MAEVIFFLAAIGAIGGAVAVVRFESPFYSVLALVVHLISLSLLFLLLMAEFLAAAQLIVYAGAVMVLYVFVVSYVGGTAEPLEQGGVPRTLAPIFGVALLVAERGWGLFNLAGLPPWGRIVLGVIALDLIIYAQHYVFHHVPVLWRLHRMHHADLDIDVTTGLRFHPLEILLSLAIKMAAVVALGVPALAVLIFEVLLNATSMFNHSNVALPRWLEPVARWIVVTPQMHQVHHSIVRAETDSNFGFNLPWWDRLFGTYCAQPSAGEQAVTIGLPIFRNVAETRIVKLLTQPFRDAS